MEEGKIGRPPIPLTPEAHAAIGQAIAEGNNRAIAAKSVGVSQDTLRRWLQRGKAGKGEEFVRLLQVVKKAEAKAVANMVQLVTTAAKTQWQAAAWYLERTQPELYGSDRKLMRELMAENLRLQGLLGNRAPPVPLALPANSTNGHNGNTPDRKC